jgi:putative heme-binding domain-containing protein
MLAEAETDVTARTAMAQALVALDPDARGAALAAALADPSLPDVSRPRIGYAITVKSDSEYLDNLREVFKRAPTRLQATLAETLVGDKGGAAALLTLIEAGQAAPRLLLAPNVVNKLKALGDAEVNSRVEAMKARLPAPDAIIDALIIERRRSFARATTNRERGEAVFAKHCANCHQIAGKGAMVGPQLDGIGNRGLDRLLEDVLDPNRNVDVAFRTTTLRLADGRIITGLVRREEGANVVVADAQGKEVLVSKAEIEEQQQTPLSLMPANVGEIVSPEEFADLIEYLLAQRVASEKN